ncbi:hypothetical protein J2S49_001136 [Arcanobacterium wilhelmae]|uniref:Nucleotidyl transferase AbiEii toxin, Type IV TA system n=1 Tax=Arcanobacterium wilhelmae TaxID=1803177 RepID=A0ABT9NC39_9ACTO|nr:nucleotidyl transferase AbiEii/AbiGii toxin family protein [Arcanobacterium wilhelmae]MDP9801060.1 hypothetical protein [Arcanobacterium wilhelmae]WFN90416.1 nucleotidyl transferase AbiEii/AbiGii toxin family protein [Arcanobacterium wilhelmae]
MSQFGFALAGSGAIREHGLIHRPTEDIDLFTIVEYKEQFGDAVGTLRSALANAGFHTDIARESQTFCRLVATDPQGTQATVDLGIDWRSEPPTQLNVGPVLNEADAVANKVTALFSRGEARDYLDVDSILESGAYTGLELLKLARAAAPGFDRRMFGYRLLAVGNVPSEAVAPYGVSAEEFSQVQRRLKRWGQGLLGC